MNTTGISLGMPEVAVSHQSTNHDSVHRQHGGEDSPKMER
jgi:hypothetical protein